MCLGVVCMFVVVCYRLLGFSVVVMVVFCCVVFIVIWSEVVNLSGSWG